jgi:hypothetical protein
MASIISFDRRQESGDGTAFRLPFAVARMYAIILVGFGAGNLQDCNEVCDISQLYSVFC